MTRRHLTIVVLLLLCSLLNRGSDAAESNKPDLALDATTKEQGAFFVATVNGSSSRPDLWFNGQSFTMFRQNDGSYRALVPV
ncbi:MAG: M23 family peptidase, partial [Chlorobium sp.]|nr:M23 family peptidase [Chlorobium sp.]